MHAPQIIFIVLISLATLGVVVGNYTPGECITKAICIMLEVGLIAWGGFFAH
jgi:hypothetical protein